MWPRLAVMKAKEKREKRRHKRGKDIRERGEIEKDFISFYRWRTYQLFLVVKLDGAVPS